MMPEAADATALVENFGFRYENHKTLNRKQKNILVNSRFFRKSKPKKNKTKKLLVFKEKKLKSWANRDLNHRQLTSLVENFGFRYENPKITMAPDTPI